MKKLLYSILALTAVSCADMLDDAEYAPDYQLGAREKIVSCYSTYGECSFDVVSNCEYTARIVKGAEWLSFKADEAAEEIQLQGSSTLELSYTANRGYRRSALVVLSVGGRHDTLSVKQVGAYQELVKSDTGSLSVPGEGGAYSVGISTNLLKKDFHFEVVDAKDYPLSGKADSFKYNDGVFSFRVLPSESRDEKTFTVRLYALDDWGEKVSANISITQKPGRQ